MKAILLKEIKSFFGSPIAYLVIGTYLTINGLFLWVLEGETNILNSGFADLTGFFSFSPWVLMLLVPAITMKSFSEEIKSGTIELLLTKPLSIWSIVFGKFIASTILTVLALLPTLIYVKIIYDFGYPVGNLDLGVVLGSYLGLLFLILSFNAIGTFTSAITTNQIVAFISAILISFLLYYGMEGISALKLTPDTFDSAYWGMQQQYDSINKGVLDTRNLIYFISITVLFLQFTTVKINSLKW